MTLYDFTKDFILKNAVLDGSVYRLILGDKIEVTTLNKRNCNQTLSGILSSQTKSDKFMTKYVPSNEILFDADFIESDMDEEYASCLFDKKSCSCIVGHPQKYPIFTGVLTMSCTFSANSLVEANRKILYGNQLSDFSVKNKVKLVAVGLRGENLVGVFHIPYIKGLAISVDASKENGRRVVSGSSKNCWRWNSLTIEDWFADATIKAVESEDKSSTELL